MKLKVTKLVNKSKCTYNGIAPWGVVNVTDVDAYIAHWFDVVGDVLVEDGENVVDNGEVLDGEGEGNDTVDYKKLNKDALVEYCEWLGIFLEGDETKKEMYELIEELEEEEEEEEEEDIDEEEDTDDE